jgi:hypothetical protein
MHIFNVKNVFVVFQELGICQVSADSYQKILVTNGGLILYKVGFKKSIYVNECNRSASLV